MGMRARNARVIRLYRKGLTYQQIAEKMGITRQAIHQLISRELGKQNRNTAYRIKVRTERERFLKAKKKAHEAHKARLEAAYSKLKAAVMSGVPIGKALRQTDRGVSSRYLNVRLNAEGIRGPSRHSYNEKLRVEIVREGLKAGKSLRELSPEVAKAEGVVRLRPRALESWFFRKGGELIHGKDA